MSSNYRPLDVSDYCIDDNPSRQNAGPSNRLLNDDGHAVHTTDGSVSGLAAIAAALDRHAPFMTPEHLEKAVWWIKEWKAHRLRRSRLIDDGAKFFQSMQVAASSPELNALRRRARLWMLLSHALAFIGLVLAFAAAASWFVGDPSWSKRVGLTAGALVFAALTGAAHDMVMRAWQTQDRVYFLHCLRASRWTEDLLDAGLFAHDPRTDHVSSAEDFLAARRRIRQMQEQLADALYFDHDRTIRQRHDELE